jgi:4-amino-4-deoxy-L-arabinose transferase-like glycosyltransferase
VKVTSKDALAVLLVALGARAGVVAWAAARFPPAADGSYYHQLAMRLAAGHGYTWLWPDGVVTYAAHYPVGYPALLAGLYALFSASPVWAMSLNALVGSLAAPAAYAVTREVAARRGALLAGLLVALHPALLLYTPAVMTEGFVAALIVIAAWVALGARRHGWPFVGLGIVLGVATLIRPQTLLLAPLLGLYAVKLPAAWKARALSSAATTLVALAVCAPWTVRNCARMDRCVFVSANGGWNLLIGSDPAARGTFAPVADAIVPPECRTVFGEAEKDACFAGSAVRQIRTAPAGWLALVPYKLAHTFDFAGAAGWYLEASNPAAFGARGRMVLAVAEIVVQRAALVLALAALALLRGPRRRARRLVGIIAALSLLTPTAWVAYLALCLQGVLLGRLLLAHLPALTAVSAVATTALAHAVFFGAGRYSLVCYGALALLSGCVFRAEKFAGSST